MDASAKGICPLPVAAVRREPSHRSEMVSQLLFGETYTIIDEHGSWWLVKGDFDAYIGWIEKAQGRRLGDDESKDISGTGIRIVADVSALLKGKDFVSPVHLPCGSIIHARGGYEPLWLPGNMVVGTAVNPSNPLSLNSMCGRAADFMGSPYLWGGRTHYGFDCSGYVQVLMRLAGIFLPRDSSQQAMIGEVISFSEQTQPGDVAFFDDEEGRIIHTGIIVAPGRIVHASGMVREDRLDHHGIYNVKAGKYSHKLRLVRRYEPGVDYLARFRRSETSNQPG